MKATTDTINKENTANKLAYTGGGIGMALFAIFGVMNASFLGGIVGLNIAGALMGFPVETTVMAKALVALGMLTGVLVAGIMFVMAGAVAGWVLGKAIDTVGNAVHHQHEKAAVTVKH